jgi:uncharacterized membrane protein
VLQWSDRSSDAVCICCYCDRLDDDGVLSLTPAWCRRHTLLSTVVERVHVKDPIRRFDERMTDVAGVFATVFINWTIAAD